MLCPGKMLCMCLEGTLESLRDRKKLKSIKLTTINGKLSTFNSTEVYKAVLLCLNILIK